MIEECVCCGAYAPPWESEEYADWTLELTADGVHLGVVCPGCFAGEGLAFVAVEPAPAVVVRLKNRSMSSSAAAASLSQAA